MNPRSQIQMEIDNTLRLLGSAEARPGLEKRVNLRLQNPPRGFSFSMTKALSACAVATSVAVLAVVLDPPLHNLVFHRHASVQSMPAVASPRVMAPTAGGFGTASAVHVPVEPLAVQPTPVNQGRGRSRSGRTVLPNGSTTALPRGVAAPKTSPADASAPDSSR